MKFWKSPLDSLLNKAVKLMNCSKVQTLGKDTNTVTACIKQLRAYQSRNVYNHSAYYILSSRFLCKNIPIKIYRTIILSLDLYGCQIWSFILREEYTILMLEHKLGVFDMFRKNILGPKREQVIGICMIYIPHQKWWGWSNQEGWHGYRMWRVWGKKHAYRIFIETPERKKLFGGPRRRGQYNMNIDLK